MNTLRKPAFAGGVPASPIENRPWGRQALLAAAVAALAAVLLFLAASGSGPSASGSATLLSVQDPFAGGHLLGPAVTPGSLATGAQNADARGDYGDLPLSFEPNAGRYPGSVQFTAATQSASAALTDQGATLTRQVSENRSESVTLAFPGADLSKADGRARLPSVVNDLRGSDPDAWRIDIPTFAGVSYANAYPGTDLVFHGTKGGNLEYDFRLKPGADPSALTTKVASAEGVRLARDGGLAIREGKARFHLQAPVAYQPARGGSRDRVKVAFRLDGDTVGFDLGRYDRSRALVIDPVSLGYSTYLGGSQQEEGLNIAVDSAGSAYVGGYTLSPDFDVKGAAQPARNGSSDAFVTKLNPAGTDVVYSTYLGGNGSDAVEGMAVDDTGSAYAAGYTSNGDFPRVNSVEGPQGGGDIFLSKLNPAGSAFVYSSTVGGSAFDYSTDVAVDSQGNAYVAGYTDSADFNVVGGVEGDAPGSDSIVTKFAPSGSTLAYSTYVGGDNVDGATGIALDSAGAAYVTGYTLSSDFNQVNAIEGKTASGGYDVMAYKVAPSGGSLDYSTYLGGSAYDVGAEVAVGADGSAYLTGVTQSSDLNTVNSLQPFGGPSDAFVAKLTPAGGALTYSTFLGGTGSDSANGIAVDSSGAAYVVGNTLSADFPLVQAYEGRSASGGNDGFVTKLNPAGSALEYSTSLGGTTGQENLRAIAVDSLGWAYVTGMSEATDYDTATPYEGDQPLMDTVITKLKIDSPPTANNDSLAVTEDSGATALAVTDNDTDPDGGAKRVESVTQPATGTVTLTSGTVRYEPPANYCTTGSEAPVTFTYTLNGGSTAMVSVTVSCVDDPPSAVADSATVAEDASATSIDVFSNDTDIDGGPKTISSVTQPANGTVVRASDGSGLTYRPQANFCGADSFTYTLSGGSSAAVTMTVGCVDDAPVAVADTAAVAEDAAATTVSVLGNDTDIDGGPKSIASVTQPVNGTVVRAGDGSGLTYQPGANFCGTDAFTYTLNGGSSTTVTMTVSCSDDPPVAVADSATVIEDSSANPVGVLSNDTDIDAGPKSIAAVTQPANGTVVRAGDGSGLTYSPAANFCGTDAFTYTLNGGSSTTVTMTVSCSDDPPAAVADSATVAEDSSANPIGVLDNDTDIDAGPKSIASVTQPANGTVVRALDGSGLTYTPAANACGPDSFTYTLNGGSSATVTITVSCSDDPPVAVADSGTVAEDSVAAAVAVLGNDTDIDGGPKSIASVTQPANGTVVRADDGSGLTYRPAGNYCGADAFTYTLNGGSSTTVTMTVSCTDDAPVAVADSDTVTEDASATAISVLGNDTDIDGGPKAIASVTQPANGTVVRADDGSGLTYRPAADYCGADAFTYTLNGGSSTTVTMTVTCSDDAPTAVADSDTVAEDASATAISVLGNDTDIDGGPKTISSVTQPANGTVVRADDGSGLTYRPGADYCNSAGSFGPDTFTYTLNGGSTATVSVTVSCVDDLPVAVADSATVAEDSASNSIAVLDNDTDVDGGPKVVASVTAASHGTAAVGESGAGVTYTPAANFCGPDSFTYTLNGGSSTTVSVTVSCSDDSPVAVADSGTVTEDAPATAVSVLGNDTDIDGGPKAIASVTQPANGTVVRADDGSGLTYRPAADYCGADAFTYTLNGGSTTTVTMTVSCADDAPVAVADSGTVTEDASATVVSVLGNDTDIDGGPKTIASVTQPANGTVVRADDGSGLTYRPAADYCGADAFTYTLNGGSSTTVTMTVSCTDDAPVAVADSATVGEDSGANAVDVLGNDTDIDGGPKHAGSVTQGTHGTVATTGGGTGVSYTPAADYCGADSFTYTLNGGSSATVSVDVACSDDAPVAVGDSATVGEDDPATAIAVMGNDSDVDGGPKTIASVTQPAGGTVVRAADGSGLTYRPNANYCNAPTALPSDDFTYTLAGGSTATVSVTVPCADDLPVAVADSAGVGEDSGVNAVDVLANDTDVDGGAKQVASVTQGTHGTVAITGGGTGVSYTPAANYCGTDSFTYTLNGGSSATVSVDVACVDDAPVAVGDSPTVTEDDPAAAIAVMGNDTDVDDGPKSIASVTQPVNGTVVRAADGSGLTYEPAANYCGSDPFTYTLDGGSSTTVSVAVTCVDDLPVAVADSAAVGEDSGASAVDVLANDTDIDGGPKQVSSVTQGTHGTVAITGGGDGLSYTPAADYCGTDSFTYELNGGSSATVSITVTCSNDDPQAQADAKTLTEDDPATPIDVLANDVDPDDDAQVASATQPAHGAVAITGGGTGVSYTPAADYCGTDSFTYKLNGGSEATVTLVVDCVEDAPVARADAATVGLDSAASPVDVLANDTDVDAGPRSVASVTQPANGTVVRAADGSGLTYQPATGYCNTRPGNAKDAFTYELNGGSAATVTMTVTCPADPAPAQPAPGQLTPSTSTPSTCRGRKATIVARAGRSVRGTRGNDVILGTDRGDRIDGAGGDDLICGGGGADVIAGAGGADRIYGGDGRDRIAGGAGHDVMAGGQGGDRVGGGDGRDFIQGDQGDDRVAGNDDADTVSGNEGDDVVSGGEGRDRVLGRSGDDQLSARDQARDSVDGGPGNDTAKADRQDRLLRCEKTSF